MKKVILVFLFALISSKNLRFMADGDAAAAGQVAKGFKGFENFQNSVGEICSMWGGIVSAFKTTHQTKIVKYLPGEGFRQISMSTNFMAAGGMRLAAWNTIWDRKLKLFGLSEKDMEKALVTLEFAQFSDQQTWASTTLGFNTEDGARDGVKAIDVITNVDDEIGKFDYMIVDFSMSFKFAPNIQWVSKAGSYAGGIWSQQKDELIEIPRGITDDDIKALMEMFKMLSFKAIAAIAGVTLSFDIV